jgi:hypothetical protein
MPTPAKASLISPVSYPVPMDQDSILDGDKVVGISIGKGTDHGRIVIQGPKGGFYLLSLNGTRKYIKKSGIHFYENG